MILHDISVMLQENMVMYPGDTLFQREEIASLNKGDDCNLSRLFISAHAGTHLDAPKHFVAGGKSIDAMPLNLYYGPALVADCTGHEAIGEKELEPYLKQRPERLLLKTDASGMMVQPPFQEVFPYLTSDGAQAILQAGVKLLGIDYITIDAFESPGYPVHNFLLKEEVAILEGLHLQHIEPKEYILAAFPLKLKDSDGSPCRAVLLEEDNSHEAQ